MTTSLSRRLAAEFGGTGFLVAAVVGSGIMAERLSQGNVAVALLANTLATGAALVALILALGPISGAQLNPVVTLALAIEGVLRPGDAVAYACVQIAGGVSGAIAAHSRTFGLPVISAFHITARSGAAQLFRGELCGHVRPAGGDSGLHSFLAPVVRSRTPWAPTSRQPIGSRHLRHSPIQR